MDGTGGTDAFERACVGLRAVADLLPGDDRYVDPPQLPELVHYIATEIAAVPTELPLPEWLVKEGVGVLLEQYLDDTTHPHLAGAVGRLVSANAIEDLSRITDHPTTTAAVVPPALSGTAVATPVLRTGRPGVLLVTLFPGFDGATAGTGPRGRFGAEPSWKPVTDGVLTEARRAMGAAADFLTDLGLLPRAPAVVTLAAPSVVAPVSITECHAAAALALTHVALRLDLPTPADSGVLVLGRALPGNEWGPADTRLIDAVRRPLLYRAQGKWVLDDGAAEPRTSAEPGLAGAADLLWGDRLRDMIDRQRSDVLTVAGWSWRLGPAAWPAESVTLPEAESILVEKLRNQFALALSRQKPTTLVLGGPVSSGKSVAARQLTKWLTGHGWTVLVLKSREGALPSADDLAMSIDSAISLSGTKIGHKTLIVLEGLHAIGRTDIGDVLLGAQNSVRANVLAVARYDTEVSDDWDPGSVDLVASITGRGAVRQLAEKLLAQHPNVYGAARTDLPDVVHASGNDLQLLCELLAATAQRAPEDAELTLFQFRDRIMRARLAAVDEACAGALRLLAALSLIGTWLPEDHVTPEISAVLRTHGARSEPNGLILSSAFHAQRLLMLLGEDEDEDEDRASVPAVVALLVPHLVRLADAQSQHMITHLIHSCRTYDLELLGQLLDVPQARAAFAAWVHDTEISSVAAVLLLLEFLPDRTWIVDQVTSLLRNAEQRTGLRPGQLASILRLVVRYRPDLEDLAAEEGSAYQAMIDLLTDPDRGLRAILDRPATLSERYGAANQLARLVRDDIDALVVGNAGALLHGVQPKAEHYRLLRKLDMVVERCRPNNVPVDDDRPLSSHEPLQELLGGHFPTGSGFDTQASWLAFQVHFGGNTLDWKTLLDEHMHTLGSSMRQASAAEIARALTELADVRHEFATTMVNRMRKEADLVNRLITILSTAKAAEAAELISTVSKAHGGVIREVLYEQTKNGLEPNEQLAVKLANQARIADAKGIGILLSAINNAVEWFSPNGLTFATRVAENIGRVDTVRLVGTDTRPAVLYHFFRALHETGVSYWDELENKVFETIVASLRSAQARPRPWAAHLALLLGEDEYLGEDFLQRLRRQVPERFFLRHMTTPIRADSLVHLYRLARVLHHGVPAKFVAAFAEQKENLLPPLLKAPPQALIEYLRLCAETRILGGERNANTKLIREVHDVAPFTWDEKFRDLYAPGDLAQALNSFTKLDHGTAVTVAHALAEPPEENQRDFLMRMLLRAVRSPADMAELLHACRRIDPGLGTRLYHDLVASTWGWTTFTKNLQYEQNPALQCKVGIQLTALGLAPDRDNVHWMQDDLLDKRWIKLAGLIRSPHVVAQLLRLLHMWKPMWARKLADSLETEAIVARFAHPRPTDLANLPGLINMLALVKDEDGVTRCVDTVRANDQDQLARTIGLHHGSRLLHQLTLRSPEDARAFGVAFAGLLAAALGRRIVIDERRYWREIGWAAAMLHRTGLGVLIPAGKPAIRPHAAYVAEVSWAATWLPGVDAPEDAVREFVGQPRTDEHADRIAMLVIHLARAGASPEFDDDLGYWSQIGEAGLGLLTLAFETTDDEAVARLLEKLTPSLRTRLDHRALAADPFRAEARRHLT